VGIQVISQKCKDFLGILFLYKNLFKDIFASVSLSFAFMANAKEMLKKMANKQAMIASFH